MVSDKVKTTTTALKELFEAARLRSVPLVAIRTADQGATVNALREVTTDDFPFVLWDAARGISAGNEAGMKDLKKSAGVDLSSKAGEGSMGFVDALDKFGLLSRGAVMVALNAHRQLQSTEPAATASAIQAVANLRDELKKNNRVFVMLTAEFTPPPELDQDIVVMRHELPGPDELKEVLTDLVWGVTDPRFKAPTGEELDKSVRAVSGLTAFSAEQQASMSLTPTGLDNDALWERKRTVIGQTRGLKVHRGGERFSDIVGLENVKARLRQRAKGRVPVGVVLVLDEIDKVFANIEGDLSGVRMDQFRTFLTEMEDNEWEGMLLAGMPGGGKSLLGKAFGNEIGVPTVMMDMGAMEGSLVGESEGLVRHAIQVIKAIGGGHAYVITTSNNATVMRPEMQRRLTGGFYFIDVMGKEERAAAWTYYIKKYGLDAKQVLPNDESWSAAEIRNCARDAWNSGCSLLDAARFILPVAQARASEFEDMRKYAHGRYLDANVVGKTYEYSVAQMAAPLRSIQLDPGALSAIVNMKES